jgi:hypothetical protein
MAGQGPGPPGALGGWGATRRRTCLCLSTSLCLYLKPQGAGEKKSVTPWWVSGSEAKKGPGPNTFWGYFLDCVFELLSPRNAQKRDKKTPRKKSDFSVKKNVFKTKCKVFRSVFLTLIAEKYSKTR